MKFLKLNLNIDITTRDIKQMQALMDVDIWDDDKIESIFQNMIVDMNMIETDDTQKKQVVLMAAAFALAQYVDDQEKSNPKGDGKSKFQQRLEDAQKLQQEKTDP